MQLRQADALVLDVVDLHEKDRIVTFLTAEHGRKKGVARGARAKFSRFAGQLQPLAKVDLRWAEKEGRELVRISDVSLLRPSSGLEDLEGLLLGAYLAEHMDQFAQEDDPSAPLFRLLESTLEALASGEVERPLASRYYEIWMLRLQGLLPVPRECPLCGEALGETAYFLEAESAIVCASCAAGHRATVIDGPALAFLRRSGRENLQSLAADPPPERAVRRGEILCRPVRRHFLQGELRSYRVMRETLAAF
ncbi:MAG: DNA repair protein RecO [Acidobacteriota bacterium]